MTELTDQRQLEREEVLAKARAAKQVAPLLATLPTPRKDAALTAAAEALEARADEILKANAQDLEAGRAAGMPEAQLDRLALDRDRIAGIAGGLRQVAGLQDPVGEVVRGGVGPLGMTMKQVRVPLGVMGMVYEARPNVTVDAFGLALKSGNVALLRGSKTARHSNAMLVSILQDSLEAQGLPRELVQLLPCDSHDSVQDLITARGLVDVVIPRGPARLIDAVVTGATVPAIETGTGNCHFYIDKDGDLDEGIAMLLNGKTRRPSVCNATETALIDGALSPDDQLRVITALQEAGVTVHGDVDKHSALGAENVVAATEADWSDEYLSMDIAVQIVDGVEGAIEHIAKILLRAHRGDRVDKRVHVPEIRRRGRRCGRDDQRLHRIHGWGAVRNGRGNRHLDAKAARPRTYGFAGADQHEVDSGGNWPDARLVSV